MSETTMERDEELETIDVNDLEGRMVKLGRRGENDTQTVVIDAGSFLTAVPGATLQVAAIRPGESEVYLPTVTVADGVITWKILAADTEKAGNGYGEVRAVQGEKIKKSGVFRTVIYNGL